MMRRTPLKRRTPLVARTGLQAGTGLARTPAGRRRATLARTPATALKCTPRPRKAAKDTGFSPAVKKAVRARAHDCCEACGFYLGPDGGQFQHRLARKAGGRKGPMRLLINSPANAALLCGTPVTGDHGLCEARNARMHEAGFWLTEDQDPLEVPILRATASGGVRKWLTRSGGYSDYSPAARGEPDAA